MQTETQLSPDSPSRPRRGVNLLWPMIVVALIVGGLLLYRHHRAEEKPEAKAETPTVAVAKVDREDLFNEVRISAEFRPFEEVELHAKVSGFVDKVNVDFGDKVKTGQLLATLVVPELKDELEAARAVQTRAEADYKNTHLVYGRLQDVNVAHSNLVAQQDIDTAQAKDNVAAAAIASAKADVGKYQTLLDYTQITAPFDGVVTARYVDPGALIQDSQAKALLRVSDNYLLRLDFPVSVAYVKDIHVGDKVDVRVQSLDNKLYTGDVTRFTSKVTEDTRTMITEIEVPNPNLELIPGMYAEAALQVERRNKVLSVPIEAVAAGAHPTVYVVNANQQIEERPVKLGLETAWRCEIVSGLSEGDEVMIGGRSTVHQGEKVLTKPWESTVP